MKIGINGGILTHNVTGIGRYLISLLEQFSKNEQHEYFLYLPTEIDMTDIVIPLNMSVRYSCFYTGFGKKLWEQLILPLWAKKDELDVFWSPSHHLPLWFPPTISRVVTIHDVVWKKFPETMTWWNRFSESFLMPMAIKYSDHIISVSASTANDVVALWPEAINKLTVVYPGVTELKKTNDKNNYLHTRGQYILFVGTLEPRKNLTRLIKAYLSLPDDLLARYDLVVVGGKGWGEGLGFLDGANKYFADKIHFMGYLSDSELDSFYEHAALFTMPSIYEGFGLPLLEAMSHGVPVLTSSCSSMPEVVNDAAILVEPTDIAAISEGIHRVLSDKKIYKQLVERARIRVAYFSWEKATVETLAIFERSITNRK